VVIKKAPLKTEKRSIFFQYRQYLLRSCIGKWQL